MQVGTTIANSVALSPFTKVNIFCSICIRIVITIDNNKLFYFASSDIYNMHIPSPMMRSSSNNSCNSATRSQKAAEAELISRATQTAIVAARSILMAGGNEEVALKTAKAAAESVLNPMNGGSDNDSVTGSGRSRSTLGGAFGGRKRKAKRQAEVVASMALIAASSTHHHPNGMGGMGGMGMSGMGECDSFNNGNPYGRNITIRHQDEPSVLSGSISLSARPPRVPKPNSPYGGQYNGQGMHAMSDNHSAVQSQQSQQSQSQQHYHHHQQQQQQLQQQQKQQVQYQYRHPQAFDNSQHQQLQEQHQQHQQQQVCSPSNRAIHDQKLAKQDDNSKNNILSQIESDSVSHSSTMDSEQQSSVESHSLEGTTMSDTTCADDSFTAPHVREMDIEEDEDEDDGKKKETEQKPSWNIVGIIMSPLAATMNIFNCGLITTGDAARDVEELENIEKDDIIKDYRNKVASSKQKILDRLSSPRVEGRDDTFDEQTDSYDGGHRSKTERRDDYRDPDFVLESSYSEGSSSAPSNLSDGTEGNIQVRSSIRETMEDIVSKSKKSYRQSKDNENKATFSSSEMRKKSAHNDNKKKLKIDTGSRTTSSRFPVSPRISKLQTTQSTSNSTIIPSPKKSAKSVGSKKPRSFFRKNRGRQ